MRRKGKEGERARQREAEEEGGITTTKGNTLREEEERKKEQAEEARRGSLRSNKRRIQKHFLVHKITQKLTKRNINFKAIVVLILPFIYSPS